MAPQIVQRNAAKAIGGVGQGQRRETQHLAANSAPANEDLDLVREMADPFGEERQYFRGNDYY